MASSAQMEYEDSDATTALFGIRDRIIEKFNEYMARADITKRD
jgi:hypothetical protein